MIVKQVMGDSEEIPSIRPEASTPGWYARRRRRAVAGGAPCLLHVLGQHCPALPGGGLRSLRSTRSASAALPCQATSLLGLMTAHSASAAPILCLFQTTLRPLHHIRGSSTPPAHNGYGCRLFPRRYQSITQMPRCFAKRCMVSRIELAIACT